MRRVEVRWLDSIRVEPAWTPASETKPRRRDLRHTTVGFLAVKERDYIVVCSSRQDTTTNVVACIVIPRRSILRLRRLP